jgi:hypothetical protein
MKWKLFVRKWSWPNRGIRLERFRKTAKDLSRDNTAEIRIEQLPNESLLAPTVRLIITAVLSFTEDWTPFHSTSPDIQTLPVCSLLILASILILVL